MRQDVTHCCKPLTNSYHWADAGVPVLNEHNRTLWKRGTVLSPILMHR